MRATIWTFERDSFRVRGDAVEIYPGVRRTTWRSASSFSATRSTAISEMNVADRRDLGEPGAYAAIYPGIALRRVARKSWRRRSRRSSRNWRSAWQSFEERGQAAGGAAASRSAPDTIIEMLQEIGFCSGIENYSRYFDGRQPGGARRIRCSTISRRIFCCIIDESARDACRRFAPCISGDRARKDSSGGLRLPPAVGVRQPSAASSTEFDERVHQTDVVSARRPAAYELERRAERVEQIIRPTGLLDPADQLSGPPMGQVDDLIRRDSQDRTQRASGSWLRR